MLTALEDIENAIVALDAARQRETQFRIAYAAANAALRGSEARVTAILETVADGVFTIDAAGVIESLNPAAERLVERLWLELDPQCMVGCSGEDFASILKSLGYVAQARPGPAITVPRCSSARAASAAQTVTTTAAFRKPMRRIRPMSGTDFTRSRSIRSASTVEMRVSFSTWRASVSSSRRNMA